MFQRRARVFVLWLSVSLAAILQTAAGASDRDIGVDHIPLAVLDLQSGVETFQKLGFTLKPGRDHANSIRNSHVKFPDGSGIELLEATKDLDALSSHYLEHLRRGEGPAFLSLHCRNSQALHDALREGRFGYHVDNDLTQLTTPELSFLFFVRDNRSKTDRPEHFVHPNGAIALSSVWIATEHGETLSRLLKQFGGSEKQITVCVPRPMEATVVTLASGDVVIFPESEQIIPGRPVIGASFQVHDLSRARETMVKSGVKPSTGSNCVENLVVDPASALGLWIEFKEEN